jgi:hypothetical protein
MLLSFAAAAATLEAAFENKINSKPLDKFSEFDFGKGKK